MFSNTNTDGLRQKNKLYEFFNKVLDIQIRSKQTNYIENSICRFFFVTGTANPYFKYFLAKENDFKDNLIMLHEAIRNRRIQIATTVFVGYNIAKAILWRYGYFAHFFFHTRFMSFALYLIALRAIHQRFKNDLRSNELWRYYNKRNKTKMIENNVNKTMAKEMLIQEKLK
jgi:hypothetical protein